MYITNISEFVVIILEATLIVKTVLKCKFTEIKNKRHIVPLSIESQCWAAKSLFW